MASPATKPSRPNEMYRRAPSPGLVKVTRGQSILGGDVLLQTRHSARVPPRAIGENEGKCARGAKRPSGPQRTLTGNVERLSSRVVRAATLQQGVAAEFPRREQDQQRSSEESASKFGESAITGKPAIEVANRRVCAQRGSKRRGVPQTLRSIADIPYAETPDLQNFLGAYGRPSLPDTANRYSCPECPKQVQLATRFAHGRGGADRPRGGPYGGRKSCGAHSVRYRIATVRALRSGAAQRQKLQQRPVNCCCESGDRPRRLGGHG